MIVATTSTTKRARWLRYSLRTFLIAMLLLGVVFGALGATAYEASRQRKVVLELAEMGVIFGYSDDHPTMPALLDTEYFDRIVSFKADGEPTLYEIGAIDSGRLDPAVESMLLEMRTANIDHIKPLRQFTNLKKVFLRSCNVKDISPLARCSRLEKVTLVGVPVSEEQVQELQKALPNRTICYDDRLMQLPSAESVSHP